ncbi:MmgE/PrpD family protein [Paraburkholderia sp. MM5384-R2]|uniref:MmgE/PrpD family protein n=1 Tax=Paraburkholderia sp. MM5384-R2 TaxID=2723097 RepID=UPI001616DA19|nr:MmgE/PrpD family protein [Paraburkholderia sp. MM5384-R2]MBB5498836.1 2-methylcitrate dehydratase PrpD [Paraburkholderia sp. MM5384-R2]
MDASLLVARHLATLSFADLPRSALDATRNNILDTIGVAIAGASAPGCREVARAVLDNAPGSQAWVWGTGRMAVAADAALANGTMAHALDFDDTHDAAVLHAGVSTVPAALAIADRLGGVNGVELLTAVAAGLDFACRLGVATRLPPVASGWAYTALFGLFGATAAAGKLMKLDAERMGHALGIAYAQAAGNSQCMPDAALTKRMQPGFAARTGVLSATLAAAGITGTTNTFEGRHGLAHVYLRGEFDRDRLLRDLGLRFEHEDLGYKPYPSCRHTHNAIDIALRLARDHNIDPANIERIDVAVNREAYDNVCTPVETKTRPRSVVDAQFSIPFCIATALLKREVFIDAFADDALRNEAVLRIASLVSASVDDDMQERFGRAVTPAAVFIGMKDGTRYNGLSDVPRGGIDNPMDFDALVEKFRRCVHYAGGPFFHAKSARLVDMLGDLESVRDVRQITVDLA